MRRFKDRTEAGRLLGEELLHLQKLSPLVIGLARGGVVVAAPIADRLAAPLDVLVARKVGAPHHPEYGIGAIAPGGVAVFDEGAIRSLGLDDAQLDLITEREAAELDRRLRVFRGDEPLSLAGRCAIIVDDGLATGITALAAVRYARTLGPQLLVFAVPVTSQQGADLIRREVDEFVSLHAPFAFRAVGEWYEDFNQTSDREVIDLLASSRRRRSA